MQQRKKLLLILRNINSWINYKKNVNIFYFTIIGFIGHNSHAQPYKKQPYREPLTAITYSFLDNNNLRFGFVGNYMMIDYSIGPFFEYQFSDQMGTRVGMEYAEKNLSLKYRKVDSLPQSNHDDAKNYINKNLTYDIDDEYVYYEINSISIPLQFRFYTYDGDLAIFTGIYIDFLINAKGQTINSLQKKTMPNAFKSAKNDEEKLISMLIDNSVEIPQTSKTPKGDILFNTVITKWFLGVDYSTSFGLLFGAKYLNTFSDFINYNKDYLELYFYKFEIHIGFDFMKILKKTKN